MESFDQTVFSSELFFVDLGRLVRFLTKWRLDLGSFGRLESIGMLEIFGHRAEWILDIFVNNKLVLNYF